MIGPDAILWRDESLVAVLKPAGLLTIPGRTPGAPTLREELERLVGERLLVVHRLDRETSGVVVFARSEEAHRRLCLAFERREVEKRYLAWVAPGPVAPGGEIVQDLVPARRGFVRVARAGEHGQRAVTGWTLLGPRGEGALLELRPLTGRTHQIRIALAEAGMPIVGEPHYRSPEGVRPRPGVRLFLHAHRLAFAQPATGEAVEIEAPPPRELER